VTVFAYSGAMANVASEGYSGMVLKYDIGIRSDLNNKQRRQEE
jgi:hypothetical protein